MRDDLKTVVQAVCGLEPSLVESDLRMLHVCLKTS